MANLFRFNKRTLRPTPFPFQSSRNMKRRKFIQEGLLLAGALTLGHQTVRGKSKKKTATLHKDCVEEPARQVPILLESDVLVVGGGPSGVAAALSAARLGMKTCLVERYNHLGGLWTGGLVLPLNCTHGLSREAQRTQVIHGISGEITDRLRRLNMVRGEVNPLVDPEACKYVLEKMMQEAGVTVVYHAWAAGAVMDGRTIRGIFAESKSGRRALLAKVVIDCTGDGDVFHWAGEKYLEARYAIGMEARLGGTDRVNHNAPGYEPRGLGAQTPIPGVTWHYMWGDAKQDGLDVMNLSRLQQKFRLKIWEDVEKLRQQPGYEQVFLLDTASQLGIRTTRILNGCYQLTLKDTMTYRNFDDCIGVSGAYTTINYDGRKVPEKERPYWQIPYRALLPRHTDNLLVAGRCFSYEEALTDDAREIGTCLVTGQGAGTAAALAIKGNDAVRNVSTARLKSELEAQGVWFDTHNK